jgi:hypothetical protein
MAWQTPKTNWMPGDGIMAGDLNRAEENTALINNTVRRVFSFGGRVPEAGALPANRAFIVAASMIQLRPEYRSLIHTGGVYPTRTYDSAFIVLRNTMYTAANPTWAQLTNGAIDQMSFTLNPIVYPLPAVSAVTDCCAMIGFVNTSAPLMLDTNDQMYATITPALIA